MTQSLSLPLIKAPYRISSCFTALVLQMQMVTEAAPQTSKTQRGE